MNKHFFEVRTFKHDRPTGILPSKFPTEDEAIAFANKLKRMYVGEDVDVRIYEIKEINY